MTWLLGCATHGVKVNEVDRIVGEVFNLGAHRVNGLCLNDRYEYSFVNVGGLDGDHGNWAEARLAR